MVHLTNDIKTIPERYRSGAKVIREKKEIIRKKIIDGQYVIDEAKARVGEMSLEARVQMAKISLEARKFWWTWIVDPATGRTRAPAISGGYVLVSLVTIFMVRRHLDSRARKLIYKFLFMGFIAIGVLMYSAHRGHQAYLKYKDSAAQIERLLQVSGEGLLSGE